MLVSDHQLVKTDRTVCGVTSLYFIRETLGHLSPGSSIPRLRRNIGKNFPHVISAQASRIWNFVNVGSAKLSCVMSVDRNIKLILDQNQETLYYFRFHLITVQLQFRNTFLRYQNVLLFIPCGMSFILSCPILFSFAVSHFLICLSVSPSNQLPSIHLFQCF